MPTPMRFYQAVSNYYGFTDMTKFWVDEFPNLDKQDKKIIVNFLLVCDGQKADAIGENQLFVEYFNKEKSKLK